MSWIIYSKRTGRYLGKTDCQIEAHNYKQNSKIGAVMPERIWVDLKQRQAEK